MNELYDRRIRMYKHGQMYPNFVLYNHNKENEVVIMSCSCIPKKEKRDLYQFQEHLAPSHKNINHSKCPVDSCTQLSQCSSEPAEYDFQIIKGTTLDIELIYKDSTKNGVNLTGYTATIECVYEDYKFSPSIEIVNPCYGCIKVSMSAYETSKIVTISENYSETTDYTYNINLISPSGIVYRILQGNAIVSR